VEDGSDHREVSFTEFRELSGLRNFLRPDLPD
jgi:hypothetical protein